VPNNATMGTPSNNVPVLNIAKPSDAGVSVNKFKDFNVGQEGLIVNNLNLQDYNFNYKSELSGGHVEFNPNFRDGDYAKVILNEVVSNSKTAMNGFTEIYGHPADYIVANPNGITCAGCGFINTTRLALITGSSNIKNGDIESFTISPNAVLRIDGQGVGNLGLYSPSSADLVSNAIKISGDIAVYGDLKVLSGNDKYDWNLQTISSKGETSPEVAIDVYSLGGMKAGNITVIATQKGFGVNLDGDVVADAGNIEITSEGEIKLKNIVAQNDIVADSKGNLSTINNGKIIANDFVLLNSGKDISLFGDKILSNEIVLMSGNNFTNNSIINSDNDLYIEAKGNFENKSQISAVNDFELLSGKNLTNSNGLLISGNDLFISSNQS
ncbi:MAG: filamentous hemagglutinin N-terminal domain-containing protein, partial [Alphaproteobacteria bacterium]|nr:filamentous hemagglutinin N-terminal domain-containing protein [Alphaproteobacteria bacterium]